MPLTKNPEQVPMSIFLLLTTFDGGLVKKFTLLCKGFRRHIIFEFKKLMEPAIEAFQREYGEYFEYRSTRLWES